MGIPRLREKVGLVCACIAIVSLSAPAVTLGAAPPREAGHAKRTVAEVHAYWTQERMLNAKPLDAVVGGDRAPRAGKEPAPASSSVAYSSFEVTDTTSFPNRVHGKVFFTRPGVGNFTCSGTVVDAQNRATVITAGHCVHSAGVWSTNFAFAPGYRRMGVTGNAPYGVWPASVEAAPQPWVDSENHRYDVGGVVLANDALGRSLENVVGARPIAFNQPTAQRFRSYGYPAVPTSEHYFDGYRLWACDSSAPISDNPSNTSGPSTLGIGCDMTGGASGGGWVTQAGQLNGVNSYRYTNRPDLLYGPYFGSTIKALYQFVGAKPAGTPGNQAVGNGTADTTNSAPSSAPSTNLGCRKKHRKKAKRKHSAKRACKAKR